MSRLILQFNVQKFILLILQVACLLLDDAVPNRIHWPRQAELRINAMVYRPYGRNSNTKLGGNARDEPANAAHRCTVGRNRISLNCVEDRPFCETPASHSMRIACEVASDSWMLQSQRVCLSCSVGSF